MELWKWIIVILVVLLLLYLAYLYFRRSFEEGFQTTPTVPKTADTLADLRNLLPNRGNAINSAGSSISTYSCSSGALSENTANQRTYMYIFDPTAAWVQANIALLEYPIVKTEVYKSIESTCQSASGNTVRNTAELEAAAKKLKEDAAALEAKNKAAVASAIAADEGSAAVAAGALASFSR